jgi:glycosyltransferase involved in cell wall biosynthesis
VPAGNDAERLDQLATEAHQLGVRRIHSFSWRDLDDPEAGGSEVHHDQVFSRWAARGLDIAHRSSTVGPARELRRHGYRITQRGSRYTVFPRTIVAETLRRAGPRDAVVEIWNGVPWFSPVWHRGPQVTWLHHVHGPMWDQELPRPFAGVGRNLERRLAPPWYRRNPVVTLAEASRDELLELGFPARNLHVIPPGVDPRFCPAPLERHRPPLLLAVGRLARVKRFELALEAARQARTETGDVQITIVGDGPERPALEAWIERHGARSWVTLAGRVDDAELVRLYRSASLLISASLAEGWGMTITEAAACGTPAVATDVVGHRGAVVDGVTGILVPAPEQLGPAIGALLRDRARLEELGRAAAQRAATMTWDRTAADNLEVLVGAARRRAASRQAM